MKVSNLVQSTGAWRAFVAATLLALAVLAVNLFTDELQPGNAWGLAYGTLAAVLMFAVALFGVRRRVVPITKRVGLGRAQTWVQFHVYAGTVALLLFLMHAGFRWPNSALGWWLFVLSIWVSVSGLLGVFLQKWIPRILTSGLSIEVLYDRIPELIAEIRERAEQLVAASAEPVREFYRRNVAPALHGPQVRLVYYFDITGGIRTQTRQFEYLRKLLDGEEQRRFAELEEYYRAKLEIDAHYTLQRALRWWLYLHVPPSLALLALIGLHLFTVLYY